MAKAWVTSIKSVPSLNGWPVPVTPLDSSTEAKTFTTDTSWTAIVNGVRMIRFISDTDCYVNINAAATTSDIFVPADTVEFFGVSDSDVVHVYDGVS